MAEKIGNFNPDKKVDKTDSSMDIKIDSDLETKNELELLKNTLLIKINNEDLNKNGSNIDEIFKKLKEKGTVNLNELNLLKDTVYDNLVIINIQEGVVNLSETDSKILFSLDNAIINVSENEKIDFNEFIKIFEDNLIQLGVEDSRTELFGIHTDTEAPKAIMWERGLS